MRSFKFQERGWDLYSEEEGTVCEKIMRVLDLPVNYSNGHRVLLWCNILALQMTKMLTKIMQNMREQFNCKFMCV